MSIWNTLLLESANELNVASSAAWTFNKGAFQYHRNMLSLSCSSFDAAIIKQDFKFEISTGTQSFQRFDFKDFYLLIDQYIDKEVYFLLRNYWTLIMEVKFHKGELPYVLVHMASSLDGKIALNNGHSKWIGNEENLKHAHRLRAILDGILVGSSTVKNDSPQLTVRHVEGPNPTRLILSNSTSLGS